MNILGYYFKIDSIQALLDKIFDSYTDLVNSVTNNKVSIYANIDTVQIGDYEELYGTDNLNVYDADFRKALEKTFNAAVNFNNNLRNLGENATTADYLKAYREQLELLPEESKKQFKEVYAEYQNFLDLMQNEGFTDENVFNKYGITVTALNSMQNSFIKEWRKNNEKGTDESDEDYAKRGQEDLSRLKSVKNIKESGLGVKD